MIHATADRYHARAMPSTSPTQVKIMHRKRVKEQKDATVKRVVPMPIRTLPVAGKQIVYAFLRERPADVLCAAPPPLIHVAVFIWRAVAENAI